MDDREPPGYDDWFDEPEPPTLESGRGGRAPYDAPFETEEDVWTLPEDEPRRSRRAAHRGNVVIGGRALTTTQVAILAIAGLAVFIAILAAAGVFSSGTAATTPTVPTQQTLPTTVTTPSTPTVAAPTQPLKSGATGHQVKLLQTELKSLGYYTGTVDGAYGPNTQTAVAAFQSAYNLTPDGIVGPQTLKKLRQQPGG
jgi:hypothetical protein